MKERSDVPFVRCLVSLRIECQSRANIIYGLNGLQAAADGIEIETIREMRYKTLEKGCIFQFSCTRAPITVDVNLPSYLGSNLLLNL